MFLVGAGPGDPGLLTLKGKDCLQQADVVLYDHLANPVLLELAPPHAERIYIGRKGRGFYTCQEEINQTILSKAREGKCVVRLKGGDPFVFGRGGEEAEVIAEAGLPYEVIPGVTSAVAVPAYAGIPVTHRTLASTVAFVTGHEDPSKPESAVEWPRLASSDGTLVFLMGMKNLPHIVERLLQEGKDPLTPVALVRWGTYPRQQTVVGTLVNIVDRAQAEAMDPPTVIIIGEVVTLRDRLNWFESRPLFGKGVLVTRPRKQAPALTTLLTAYGAEAIECPTLDIVPPDDWTDMDKAIEALPTFQWLILTSVNGVRAWMERIRFNDFDCRRLAGLRVCCIGPGTAHEMEQWGVKADYVPKVFQAEGLIELLKEVGIAGQRILIPRAKVAREILPDELRALGATVEVVTAYRAVAPDTSIKDLKERFRQRQIHYLTFASSSTVRNFCQLFDSQEERRELMEGATVACIGPITAQTVQEQGMSVGLVASQNTIPALVESIVRYEKQTKSGQALYFH